MDDARTSRGCWMIMSNNAPLARLASELGTFRRCRRCPGGSRPPSQAELRRRPKNKQIRETALLPRLKMVCVRDSAFGLLCTLFFGVLALLGQPTAHAQASDPADQVCPRYPAGSALPVPADLYSQNHALEVTLRLQTVTDAQGRTRYCYTTAAGAQAPTLHLWPGDQLTVHLQ